MLLCLARKGHKTTRRGIAARQITVRISAGRSINVSAGWFVLMAEGGVVAAKLFSGGLRFLSSSLRRACKMVIDGFWRMKSAVFMMEEL